MKVCPIINKNIVLEEADIIFRNFSGLETQYNSEGNRNFCVILNSEEGNGLREEGWNIKTLSNEETGEETYIIPVSVSYRNIQPQVFMVVDGKKTLLDEETIDILDSLDIINVDVVIRPYNWSVNGNCGTKAYLKKMYVNIQSDQLDRKYES